jgi:hypothetical protein
VSWAYSKTWEGSSAPARSSAEVLEAAPIRTRTSRSRYDGKNSPRLHWCAAARPIPNLEPALASVASGRPGSSGGSNAFKIARSRAFLAT